MGFATVKTNPYKKKLTAKRRRRRGLWLPAWWKRLCDQARKDWAEVEEQEISPACLALIRDFNSTGDD